MNNCIFCDLADRDLKYHELFYVIRDGFPVSELHTLIIPKRHIESPRSLSKEEWAVLNELMLKITADIEAKDSTVKGFNYGFNDGMVAGQTIFHCHFHIIPRRENDVPCPRGGIRGVIPTKQKY